MAGSTRGRKPGALYAADLHIKLHSQHKHAMEEIANALSLIEGKRVRVADVARRVIEAALPQVLEEVKARLAEEVQATANAGQVGTDGIPPETAEPDLIGNEDGLRIDPPQGHETWEEGRSDADEVNADVAWMESRERGSYDPEVYS